MERKQKETDAEIMAFSGQDSDSDSEFAFQLQMEQALAASLSSSSNTLQRPPSPPIVATSGVIAMENYRNPGITDSADVRPRERCYGFDFRKALGQGNKGKGKIHETVTGVRRDDQNLNFGLGNSRYTFERPSLVTRSQETVPPPQLASLFSSSNTPQRPPSPPIVATSGVIAMENYRNPGVTDSANVRPRESCYGFDFRKALGQGNKGKGKIHETVTGLRRDDQNLNFGLGNSRYTFERPSLVTRSQETVPPPQSASLFSSSNTPQRPPSPPIVATSGVIAMENYRNPGITDSANVRPRESCYGFDFRKALGQGNKGKGIHETVTGVRRDDQNLNFGLGNSRYTFERPSLVTRSQETVPTPQSIGEGSSKINAKAGTFQGNVWYRLYFKGLVSDDTGEGKGKMTDILAGFGVAICDFRDNLLFEMKGPLTKHGTNRQGAEIKALIQGLTEALKLGIKHIAIYCDSFPVFQFVREIWVAKQKKIALLLNDVRRIMQEFSSSRPILVAGNDVKFAYKLARESIVSKAHPHEDLRQAKAARKEECVICYNDIDAERMFSIDKCHHRFCCHCMKQHVEVKLLKGMVPKCPHFDCESILAIDVCGKLLSPKLTELWKQRNKENAIPITERVYCPYPKCSALMSKSKISEAAKSLLSLYPSSGVRRCVECRALFCVDCKVPWHEKLSCTEYKNLHPNPPADDVKLKSLANNKMWRQCGKCQHMIELTYGCNHITCRCGHEFCYNCGCEWNRIMGTCMKRCPAWNEAYIIRQDPAHAYVAPAHAHVAPDNYAYNDEDDDFDYDYDFYNENNLHFEDDMIPAFYRQNEPNVDPFFDLPDGELFTPDMVSPRTLQQLYISDDDTDDMYFPEEFRNPVPGHDSVSREGQDEGMDQTHLPHSNAQSSSTTVNYPPAGEQDDLFGFFRKYQTFYDSDGYEIEDYTNPFNPEYYPQF